MKRYSKIASVGIYLPEKVETNEELSMRLGFDVDGWLRPRTGITLRHISAPNETTSDLAVKAALEALEKANLKSEDLDLILLTTDTPDYVSPPTSAVIQYKLGAKNAGCFDINAACADPTIGLSIGSQYIMTDSAINHVMVVGAYAMTKWANQDPSYIETRYLTPIFSDGAGAVILSVSDEPGYIISKIIADGSYHDAYGIYVGTAYPITPEMVEQKKHYLRFHESGHRYPADINLIHWPKLIKATVEKAGFKVEDLSLVLMTQVSVNTIKDTMKELGLPLTKTHWITDKFGYTGSACIFMALYDALKQGKIKKGDLICFCTSGVGFVMSTALFRWV